MADKPLPPSPKPLYTRDAAKLADASARMDEWARGVQAMMDALRASTERNLRRMAELEAAVAAAAEGGGGGVIGSPVGLTVGGSNVDGSSGEYSDAEHEHAIPKGSPVDLTPGGSNVDGASGDFADAEHEHALPDFGNGAGEFCEGNDSRLSNDRTASGLRTASTVVVVSGADAPTAGQVLTATADNEAEWISPVIGDTLQVWMPDAPQASPHAKDDEMRGGSVDAKWTEIDPGSAFTVSMDTTRNMMKFAATGIGSSLLGGVYQAIPGVTSYAIYAKMNCNSRYERGGPILFLAENLATNPTTANWFTCYAFGSGTAGTPSVGYTHWSAYNTAISTTSTNDGNMGHAFYMRIRVLHTSGTLGAGDGTASVQAGWSSDGVGWTDFLPFDLTTWAPVHMGIGLYAFESGIEFKARCQWFRVFELTAPGEADADIDVLGRLVSIGVD